MKKGASKQGEKSQAQPARRASSQAVGKSPKDAQIGDGKGAAGSLNISTSAELKEYLLSIRDKMADGSAPAIYCLSAMNNLMSEEQVYSLLDQECKELARDVWLRVKQAGVQLKNPPLLFSPEEEGMGGGA